jgi:HD-GYP domain-containing protein (c-di-GMP phosphodiesterase class II)
MRYVPLEFVKEGSVLGKHVYDDLGRVLLKKGTMISQSLKHRLNNYGVYAVYLEDPYSEAEIEEVIKPELRNRAVMTIKNTFSKFKKSLGEENQKGNAKTENMAKIDKVATDIMLDILENPQLVVHMVDIKTKDNYQFQHAISVSVLSLILGVKLKLNETKLKDLGTGAMLHDIGKTFMDLELLNKEKKNSQELELIKGHVKSGYDFLRGAYGISSHSRMIVFQHHENVDGSGYPRGARKDDIHYLARIVRIANDYDLLTSTTPWNKGIAPNEAIEYIMGHSGIYYDIDMVRVFVSSIIPYPNGTHVKLSVNKIGIITRQNEGFPLRPVVKILGFGEKDTEIDLIKHINIVIEKVVY